jgi:hypothetical protein
MLSLSIPPKQFTTAPLSRRIIDQPPRNASSDSRLREQGRSLHCETGVLARLFGVAGSVKGNPAYCFTPIGFLLQLFAKGFKPRLGSLVFDLRYADPVNSGEDTRFTFDRLSESR